MIGIFKNIRIGLSKMLLSLLFITFCTHNLFAQTKNEIDQRLSKFTHSSISNDLQKAEKELLLLLQDAEKINYIRAKADINSKLYTANFLQSEFEDALKNAQAALKIYEQLGYQKQEAQMLANIAWSMQKTNKSDSEQFFKQAITLAEKVQADSVLTWTYDNYGVILQTKNIDSALIFYNKALNLKIKKKDFTGVPFSYFKIASAEIERKNFTAAKKALDNAKKYLVDSERYTVLEYYAYLGDYYFANKDFQNSKAAFKKSFEISKEINMPTLQAYNLQYLSESEYGLGNYKAAFEFKTMEKQIRDSIMSLKTVESLQKLQTEYKTEKNLKEIALQNKELALREKEKAELSLKISKRTNYIYLTLTLIVLISTILLLLVRNAKIKRERERRLSEMEQEKLKYQFSEEKNRISRELHDNIGSQLTFMISSMENLTYRENIEKEKLNKISDFGRETLSELRSTVWAINEKQGTIGSLINRLYNLRKELPIEVELIDQTKNRFVSGLLMLNTYRIIQEFVQNTLKYANASKIKIELSDKENDLYVACADNGNGFDTTTENFGNGLFNMRKRAEECKGRFELKSNQNGTEMIILFEQAFL